MKHIILAGGGGARLWPFSRRCFPKQFLHFGDHESLLQKTVKRLYPSVPAKDILIVTSQAYLPIAKSQLSPIDPAFEQQILLEPEQKNTAPALCLAIRHFQEVLGISDEECVLVSSADHLISPKGALLAAALQEEALVKQGYHLLFGIRPHKPETGYGYIKTGAPVGERALKVEHFVEKPDAETAQALLLSGETLWNAGIFLFQIKTFLKEIALHCPSLLAPFQEMPNVSIDYALLEKSTQLLVSPLDVSWSDVGCWDSVYDLLNKDEHKNAKVGNVLDIDTKNCLIMGNKRLISTLGVEDLLVVDTEEALFIGKKGQSQRVKHLVETLESKELPTSHRPWGTFTVLEEGDRFKIKSIVVNPGQRLSLQMHYHRNEHWVVVRGTAKVTIADQETLLHENESIYISKSQTHRLENPGKVPLEVIEVQVGEYVGEDDIIRFEDSYQRV